MPDTLTKLAYQTFQQGKSYFGLAHKTVSTQLTNLFVAPSQRETKPLPVDLLLKIQQQLSQIIETDWHDAEQDVYPASLLFENDWNAFFSHYPQVWLDLPLIWGRVNQKQHQEFSAQVETSGYPSYYLQNFHHQTDGYLSDTSANLYDLQVDILFNGAADAMRRRILAPLKQGLAAFASVEPRQIRVLDIACGTGRTLKQIRATLPKASLYGIDLSDAYLRKANESLSQKPDELPQLLQANAEALPFLDNYFHAVTSVFLFHELPPQARQQVIEEGFRVLKPGGTMVICDSIQVVDAPDMLPVMAGFVKTFHEPYYRHYSVDNLIQRLEQAGFTDVSVQVHFMSKYLIARKPIAPLPSATSHTDDTKQLSYDRH